MSWAEDRAQAEENWVQSYAHARDDDDTYGGSSHEDAETRQYHLEVQRLRAVRNGTFGT